MITGVDPLADPRALRAGVQTHHARIGRAEEALARLDAVLRLLPNSGAVCEAALRREAIEGTGASPRVTSLRSHLLFEATAEHSAECPTRVLSRDPVMERVSRHLDAFIAGFRRVPADGAIISEIILGVLSGLTGTSDDERLAFPRSAVDMRDPRDIGCSARAPARAGIPADVREAIIDLCVALQRESHLWRSVIEGASMLHEGIAPLAPLRAECGILARIAPLMFLGAARWPFVSLGTPIERREHRMDPGCRTVAGDTTRCEPRRCPKAAAADFADGVVAGVDRVLPLVERIAQLTNDDRRRIHELTKAARSAVHVQIALQRRPIVSLPRLLEETGLGVQTVTSALHRLRGLGIVREMTSRYRHRVYSYDAYVALLGEEIG
jgi:hypothetical protein